MSKNFTTAITEIKDSFTAGVNVAQKALDKLSGLTPNIGIVFSSSNYDNKKLLEGIKKIIGDIPLIGCSTAGSFTEEGLTESGVTLSLVSSDDFQFFTGHGTSLQENILKSVKSASQDFPQEIKGFPHKSGILLIDGLKGIGESVTLAAASVLGPEVKLAGGAAGDDLKFLKTYIFDNQTINSNALSLCLVASKSPVVISVKHGHMPISQSYKVTKAQGTRVFEIDNKPAAHIWEKLLDEKIQAKEVEAITARDERKIKQFLIRYEAGLSSGNQYKLRSPIALNSDGSMNFVCTMTEGTTFKLMDSDESKQIESAREAAKSAKENAHGYKIIGALVFDCICRRMILRNRFPEAIQAIKEELGEDIPIIGFETYGEIAMDVGQLSGFHNTTTVIMLLTV